MANDDYITPAWITTALGSFGLDPCAHKQQPWRHALYQYTEDADGLSHSWSGQRVWLNPPYSRGLVGAWMGRMATHDHGTALVNVCVSARWFQRHVWGAAWVVAFMNRRIRFYRPDGSLATSPRYENALAAYGREDASALINAATARAIDAHIVPLYENWLYRPATKSGE